MNQSECIVVYCTCPDAGSADKIAEALLSKRLVACANRVCRVVSRYRWKGEIARDEEELLILKTRRDRFEALRETIENLHPYEVPEIVALPIVAGNASYLEWIRENAVPAPDAS
jgi:periplasmic divalent cation tolerance protein